MRSTTQLLVGMATAGVVAGPREPAALILGAVAGVLPDAIDEWIRWVFRQPDILVTPDPLHPQPEVIASGLRAALARVRGADRTCVARFHPIPDNRTGCVPYRLDWDPRRRFVAVLPSSGKPVAVEPGAPVDATPSALVPLHPLPLEVADAPVDLQLTPRNRRVECRDLTSVADYGHSLATGIPLVAIASCISLRAGAATAVAWIVHLLLEIGGRRETVPGWPVVSTPVNGRRFWNDNSWPINLCASALALLMLTAMLRT
jgi:hypothetical protein